MIMVNLLVGSRKYVVSNQETNSIELSKMIELASVAIVSNSHRLTCSRLTQLVGCDAGTSYPATNGADFEPVFAGANFSTEKVSGSLFKISGAPEKTAGDPKSLRSPFCSLFSKSPDLL